MKIQDLLEGLDIIDVKNEDKDLDIDMVYYDSRKVKEGGLFVAIDGLEVDGHDYIDQAIENGAVALVVTKDVDKDLPTYKTENNRKALAIISGNYYGHPSKELKIYGITGSNGKTSTSMMVNSILKAAGTDPGIIGTVMYKIGDEEIASKLTTPESLELQGIFRSMVEEGIDTCIMEVSSVSQEMFRVYETDMDIVAMNNITREHIDQHGTFEKYLEEKSKTIRYRKAKDFAILNLDDPYTRDLVDQTQAKVISFSEKDKSADVFAEDIDISTGFGVFTIKTSDVFTGKNEEARVKLRVAGYHSIANALSAAAMTLAGGISLEDVCQGLESFTGIERRFQQVCDGDFMVMDDHFANIGNINMTLATLAKMAYKKAHIVYAIRGNRGVTVNRENIRTYLDWKDKLRLGSFIATRSIDTTEAHDTVSPEELEVFKEEMEGEAYELYDRLEDAIDKALENVQEGDLILLAGCQGMDHGAKIILEKIYEKDPSQNRAKLFHVLDDRVAGMDWPK